jgi:mannose-6-phosphate isomerase-like protein (cupin superfamily)
LAANEEPQLPAIVDLPAQLRADAGSDGPAWSLTSMDLNVNLVRFDGGRGVPEHVNAEVDVLILAIEGAGQVVIDGGVYELRASQACLIPKGALRSIRSAGGPFAYLTCHRRRGGLWPA